MVNPVFAANEVTVTCGDDLTRTYDGNGTLTISGTVAMDKFGLGCFILYQSTKP